MSVPTQGDSFSKLIEFIRLAQEESAMLAHLAQANDDTSLGISWLAVSENFRRMREQVTKLATTRMN